MPAAAHFNFHLRPVISQIPPFTHSQRKRLLIWLISFPEIQEDHILTIFMKKFMLALAFFAIALTAAFAQNQSPAERDYTVAEKLYYNAQYTAAISSLNLSDQYPVSLRSKVLYLRIRVLEQLYLRQPSWRSELDHSIEILSQQKDSVFWTAERVNELERIKKDFEKSGNGDQQAYRNTAADKSYSQKQSVMPEIMLKK